MADLIKAARTRIKKKQEETPSQVNLIEQARINNAYNGGVIRPANISVPEMTVAPSGTYTPTIKPMYANANKIKPVQTPQTYKIKPVTPGSPLYSGYPFVRDYTGTAANALDIFHEQNKAIQQARLSELEKGKVKLLTPVGLQYPVVNHLRRTPIQTPYQISFRVES